VAAETSLPAGPEARNQAFRLLYRYIAGHNGPGRRLAMTAPVETVAGPPGGGDPGRGQRMSMTAPVETREADGRVTMRFLLPARWTAAEAPRPLDPRVRIVTVAARTLAVLRFAGSRRPGPVRARKRRLTAVVRELPGWRPAGPASALFYDPPWTPPPLRRNEVALPVEALDPPAGQRTSNGRRASTRPSAPLM
jgi:hypothetical protein